MVEYKCFECQKKVDEELLRKKIRCPHCGGKMIYKPRTKVTNVKAR